MPRSAWVLCLALLLAVFAGPSRADITISIQNTSVAQGGSGTIDVFLTSNASSSSPDMINFYAFQLQISNNGVDNTQLAFSSNQDFGYVSNSSLNPAYVFLGDSTAAQSSPPFIGAPNLTVYPNDTFFGGDSTNSGNPVSLSAGTTYLLASLTLTAVTNAAPMVGDSFTISLIPSAGDGSLNTNPNNFFDNFNFGTGGETSATPYTSTSGTVTIVAAAVPEPSTMVMGLTGSLILIGAHGRRRKRRHQPASIRSRNR